MSWMDFKVTVRGDKGTIANIYRSQTAILRKLRMATRRASENVSDLTKQLVPKRDRNMYNLLHTDMKPDGLLFEVGWYPAHFAARGLRFYPPFVEFGTSNSPAQPSLGPAYRIIEPYYRRDVSRAVKEALRTVTPNTP